MSTIKVRLECWWSNSQSLTEMFVERFVPEVDKLKYEFVQDNPDYTIIFGRTEWESIKTKKDNTFFIAQEPLWSPNETREGIPNYCSKIIVADKSYYTGEGNYIERLLPVFYGGRGETHHEEAYKWHYNLVDKTYVKTKPLSVIVTCSYNSHWDSYNRDGVLDMIYKRRTDLGLQLSKDPDIDIYGTYWESNGSNIKGEVFNKHIGLDDYRFTVACENTIQRNYITEKFWDAIITDTVPFYMGCSNIQELVPSSCFIYLNNTDAENKIKEVMNNEVEVYNNCIKDIRDLKREFFNSSKYNIWCVVKDMIDNKI